MGVDVWCDLALVGVGWHGVMLIGGVWWCLWCVVLCWCCLVLLAWFGCGSGWVVDVHCCVVVGWWLFVVMC